jgi:GrxC family glutaredoxin
MNKVAIYAKSWCPFCARAKSLLQSRQLAYTEIDITTDELREQEMIERSGRLSVPQIFISGEGIGGSDDLVSQNASGELDRLLGLAADIDFDSLHDVVDAGPAHQPSPRE